MKQATFFATITDTTPGIVAALLARAGDDDPATASTGTDPGQAPASTATFSVPSRSRMLLGDSAQPGVGRPWRAPASPKAATS